MHVAPHVPRPGANRPPYHGYRRRGRSPAERSPRPSKSWPIYVARHRCMRMHPRNTLPNSPYATALHRTAQAAHEQMNASRPGGGMLLGDEFQVAGEILHGGRRREIEVHPALRRPPVAVVDELGGRSPHP